jgi:prepilin-type N-terminal cleavage/methylation domain-containing protein
MRSATRAGDGFTLIEMLISIGLGSVIMYTAFAGFRAASQTVAVANRLSIENAMLRAGVGAAHDEVDFWRTYDDPGVQTALRAGGPGTALPFAPFKTAWPRAGGATREDERGYEPDAVKWAAHDSHTWFRGSMTEQKDCALIFGRYSIFANAAATPTWRESFPRYWQDATPRLTGPDYPPPPAGCPDDFTPDPAKAHYDGAPGPSHHWYYNQLEDLIRAVGFYGFADYLPANAIYETMDDPDRSPFGTCNPDGTPWFWLIAGGAPFTFADPDISGRVARSRYRCTALTTYIVPAWDHAAATPTAATLDALNRNRYRVGWGVTPADMTTFTAATDQPDRLLLQAPSTWPNASVSVAHFYRYARPVTMCRIRLVSPVTGSSIELNFAGWGTTLRGARQQRHRDPAQGWAKWDNAASAVNDPNLDSY